MRRRPFLGAAALVLIALLACAAAWFYWIYGRIERYANLDQAAPADAICVLAAAEYDGRPSPVYRARLDHALELYRLGMAPLMITLGGPGGDRFNEAWVGRRYLESQGVPEQAIIAETESMDTEEAARQIAVIARANKLRRLIVVSDGTHMFRIHAICAAEGLDVLTSPRPRPPVEDRWEDRWLEARRLAHEMLGYTAWRMHLH